MGDGPSLNSSPELSVPEDQNEECLSEVLVVRPPLKTTEYRFREQVLR